METKEEVTCDSDVQIKADLKEMQRRIAAFQARKRREVDEMNLMEFCSRRLEESATTGDNSQRDRDSCCRVDAVVVRRVDSKGHIKVSRVENQWGPQTMQALRKVHPLAASFSDCASGDNGTAKVVHNAPEGIEERINNMETHLSLITGKPVPKDIYARLKSLEDRILFLEGISPDYFADQPCRKAVKTGEGSGGRSQRRHLVPAGQSGLSLDDIESRIQTLRGSLLHRNNTAAAAAVASGSS